MISVLELFRIGIGPSSSHTSGPMEAGKRFRDALPAGAQRATVELFGSLAWTGRGHGSDTAISLGLLGETPATVDPDRVQDLVAGLAATKCLVLRNGDVMEFNPESDLILDFENLLPLHSNGMRFRAYHGDGAMLKEAIYYSIGGGFVVQEGEEFFPRDRETPYPFATAAELVGTCQRLGVSVAELQIRNEVALRPREVVDAGLDAIRDAMFNCINRGLCTEGVLPGKLRVKRRAKSLMDKLMADKLGNELRPHAIMDWVSAYAIAVNEENAAGGRVVTAPTNGAAGIVPAVLRCYQEFWQDCTPDSARTFLLTAGAIGSLIKRNASISGADVGCQGEVGSAASMAAAGLAAVLGASPAQIENAAEIAMEHHLGLTCDPIGGLVQIPCIERNAFGANKAIIAASLSMRGDGTHHVSLDQVIETMRQTGADMQSKYKETSQGGLAVNVAEC